MTRSPIFAGFAGRQPAAGRGRSEHCRSFRESPRRGEGQAANHKRAREGGRLVRTRASDGPARDRRGRPCATARAAG